MTYYSGRTPPPNRAPQRRAVASLVRALATTLSRRVRSGTLSRISATPRRAEGWRHSRRSSGQPSGVAADECQCLPAECLPFVVPGHLDREPFLHRPALAGVERQPSPLAMSASTRSRGSFSTRFPPENIAKIFPLTFSAIDPNVGRPPEELGTVTPVVPAKHSTRSANGSSGIELGGMA
jgi:hypothetical protein